MDSFNCLLIRNLRGNWAIRLIYEYKLQNINDTEFNYIDLSNMEYFPPGKSSPVLVNSKIREKIISKIFFFNPLPTILEKEIMKNTKLVTKSRFKIIYIKPILDLLAIKNSSNLENYRFRGIPFGKFLHTPFIAKFGVKHFELNQFQQIRQMKLVYRFVISFYKINHLLETNKYNKIVLINGRDVVGASAQLSAYVNKVNVICLEESLIKSETPKFSQWMGNMHHWKIRKKALDITVQKYSSSYHLNDAQSYFENNFGLNSKFWRQSVPVDPAKEFEETGYVCFFTSSEKETTTFPTGDILANEFDFSDQVECLKIVHEVANQLGFKLIIRMHPNFSGTKLVNKEYKFFHNLTKNWANSILISNSDYTNSYKLAEKAKFNFIFRSTLGLEFSFRDIPVYHLAPTFWSEYAIEKFVSTKQEVEEILAGNKLYNNQIKIHSDYHIFALYNTFQGQNFKNVSFAKNDKIFNSKHQSKYLTVLNGIELDKPRFRFFTWRG